MKQEVQLARTISIEIAERVGFELEWLTEVIHHSR